MMAHLKYYKLDFNTKTDRKLLKLLVTKKDVYQQRIDMNSVDINSIKFGNMPNDTHILGCWYDFSRDIFVFIIEHENFLKVPVGCEIEVYDTKIVSCIRLIKLPKNL